ncbi:hypothetical protein NHX12_011812 [Muraenolepis orangiensis]|uniref:Uncharacterized protein n=1 Tax=Muraenolepis orangiensis TaxID=630683 RepID=A0A9Q0DGX1_9TELE|nr:hypothetical protein NHX12_011812 [Muraenolepis orangiensis]
MKNHNQFQFLRLTLESVCKGAASVKECLGVGAFASFPGQLLFRDTRGNSLSFSVTVSPPSPSAKSPGVCTLACLHAENTRCQSLSFHLGTATTAEELLVPLDKRALQRSTPAGLRTSEDLANGAATWRRIRQTAIATTGPMSSSSSSARSPRGHR